MYCDGERVLPQDKAKPTPKPVETETESEEHFGTDQNGERFRKKSSRPYNPGNFNIYGVDMVAAQDDLDPDSDPDMRFHDNPYILCIRMYPIFLDPA